MKNSNWSYVLVVASGIAVTGCQQAPRVNAPCQCCRKQTDQPVQSANEDPGMNGPADPPVVGDPGSSALPGLAPPRNLEQVLPPPETSRSGPKITDTPMATGQIPANQFALPSTIPASEWSSSGSDSRFPSTTKPDGPNTSPPATPMPNGPALAVVPQTATTPVDPPIPPQAVPMQSAPAFSHTDDYRVLSGQVQTWRQTRKLRYADYGTVDPYGGSVVLEGSQADSLPDDCRVRVEGRLIPPSDRGSPARFQVQSIQVLGK